jgi:hypothetical protein
VEKSNLNFKCRLILLVREFFRRSKKKNISHEIPSSLQGNSKTTPAFLSHAINAAVTSQLENVL